ncbi:MAG TPA: ABC transporter permease [Terriglobia bacterium]|nr:ABC transporter permease [Terriglobia bacterium]
MSPVRQITAIALLELRRYLAARRWIGVYLLAALPVLLLLLAAVRPGRSAPMERVYAGVFEVYTLRFAIFVSCGVVFSHLIRGEMMEKTLHFYLLTPVRREILMAGKYLAALAATAGLFGLSTIASYFALYFAPGPDPGLLIRYLGIVILACATYGAVFTLIGVVSRNAALPGLILLGWETFSSLLPGTLQQLSVTHYLQPLLPLPTERGPFAIVTDAPSPAWSIPGLLVFSLLVVAVAGWRIRRIEIRYGAD